MLLLASSAPRLLGLWCAAELLALTDLALDLLLTGGGST
jgi:hypothetical protein